MSDIYFKASLQNTLNPEVGTFDNVGNKEGTFTLEDGEYYLTNNTSTGYLEYYLTKSTYSTGGTVDTVEFDINYSSTYSSFLNWCLLFHGDDDHKYWYGLGICEDALQFRGATLPYYHIVTQPSTWLHVKCIFDHYYDQNIVHIYIDNVEVQNFSISNDYYIKSLTILGNSDGYVPTGTKIKNIIIYHNKKHYLDTIGLTSLWSKIKSLFATKTELASKANTSDLNNYYTKEQINSMLARIVINQQVLGGFVYNADIDEYNNETEQTMKTVSVESTSSVNAYTIVENSDTVEEL